MDETEENERQPFVLCELDNLKHVLQPLKSTQRIRYTCFGLSQKLLVFGATSGGLYIFRREPCTFLHLIPSKDGAIVKVAVSPDEKVLAYATNKGVVILLEHNVLQSSSAASRRLQTSNEHLGAEVTTLQWNATSDDLYIGDNTGKISLLCVSVFTAKNIFQTPSMQLMQLDSSIVQMDFAHGLLLISTLTRCYLSDTEKEQYKQVGQKLRDGEFGACFICKKEDSKQPNEPLAPPPTAQVSANTFDLIGINESLPFRVKSKLRIFCARPGSRLWEVNCDGSVMSTHQLREALSTKAPTNIVSTHISPAEQTLPETIKSSFNFPQLNAIGDKFLFTFRQDGLYIFDPDNSLVVLWSNSITNISDAQVWEDTIYVWRKSGEMHALHFQPVEKCILKLYFKKEYAICAQLCHKYLDHLVRIVPSARKLHFMADLAEKLSDHTDLRQSILPLTSEILKFLPSRQTRGQKMKSGIYRIGNSIDSDEEGKSLRILGRSRKGSERSRSLSASPKRRAASQGKVKEIPRNNSAQSLPAHAENKIITLEESPFNLMTPPETIAALQDLTNILSSKLKRQWMALEGKMKYFSQEVPLLDVGGKINGGEKHQTEQTENDGLEILIPNGRSPISTKQNGCDGPNMDKIKEAIKSENFEQILTSCIVTFENSFPKQSEAFPFKTALSKSEQTAVQNALHHSFETKYILSLLPSSCDLKPDSDYPDVFKTIHSDQDLLLDTLLSKLVTSFGEILDENVILQDLIGLGLPCYFMSWCAVLNFFQPQVLKFITSESRDAIRQAITNHTCPLPRLLNVMYLLLRVSSNEGIDICLSIGENVALRDFCYVVLKLQQHKITAGNASQNIQRYCQNVLLSFLTKKSIAEDCLLEDVHVYHLAMEAFVNLNKIGPVSACNCGHPLPGGLRKYPLQFMFVGNLLLQLLKKTNVDQYLGVCRKLGLWKELINYKLEHGSDLNTLLPLILQLDSVHLFEDYLPQFVSSHFNYLLQARRKLDESKSCLNCGTPIDLKESNLDWTFIGQCVIKVMGPEKAIDLLSIQAGPGQTGLLKKSFFQSCIFATLLSDAPKKANKAVELMQKSDNSKNLFSSEIGSKVMEALSKDLSLQGVLPSDYMPPSTSDSHHWGVQVQLWDQNCPRCSLPFADSVLLKKSGVRIFPCSHAFHVACLGNTPTECLKCKVKEIINVH
ncbi:uncharacterized protein LOC132200810 [Neocloeon triangulifer]|uniref:uncharacterized protein LOC132200810 n=1 Tax=Neocloeon triangulifer TaxID=2078957 RepID=UPI00286F16B9|nr:uncharacterized protein LOC132200810 [Neocloeon triangulifer]